MRLPSLTHTKYRLYANLKEKDLGHQWEQHVFMLLQSITYISIYHSECSQNVHSAHCANIKNKYGT